MPFSLLSLILNLLKGGEVIGLHNAVEKLYDDLDLSQLRGEGEAAKGECFGEGTQGEPVAVVS